MQMLKTAHVQVLIQALRTAVCAGGGRAEQGEDEKLLSKA